MNKIVVLDEQTIDKIAAGEVIERPSSIVKELVENAIDAGATAVTVEIKEGGISFIRITDNGSGIEAEQIPTAFLRHATSKIRTAEDLLDVTSLGFRGEALSSIAAVCQVELISKTPESLTGTRYLIEGGKEKSMEEIGAPSGTTFLVRNIFYNTPARKKFLKTPQTETGYISELMERMALSHPEVSFKFIAGSQVKLHTSGNHRLKDIIYNIYGRDITNNLLEVDHTFENGMKITGFIGKPVISRGNRNFENYFVNGRYIKSKIISKAIEDAYQSFMMKHKYPFTVLHFQIDTEMLDINVHPTKMELRFAENEKLYQDVYQTILNTLSHKEMIVQVTVGKEEKEVRPQEKKENLPEPFEKSRLSSMQSVFAQSSGVQEHGVQPSREKLNLLTHQTSAPVKKQLSEEDSRAIREITSSYTAPSWQPEKRERPTVASETLENLMTDASAMDKNLALDSVESAPVAREEPSDGTVSKETESARQQITASDSLAGRYSMQMEQLANSTVKESDFFSEKLLDRQNVKEHRIIGQLFDTYWLIEFRDNLFIIDQHAAHEKVLYEKTMKAMDKREYTSQILNPPVILTLSIQEAETLQKHMQYFQEIGFEIEEFGGKEYALRAVPDNLFGIAKDDLFIEMLDALDSQPASTSVDIIKDRVATMSCKAAVKGNHKLSVSEVHALIDELMTLENPYHCPHGRPTIISMSKYEIEKKFKRIV